MNHLDKYISQLLAQRIAEAAKKMNVVLPESEYTWVLDTTTKKYKIVKIGSKDYTNYYCMGEEGADETRPQFKKGYGAMYRAYDCPELGEILPCDYRTEKPSPHNLMIEKYPDRWQIAYVNTEGDGATDYIEYKNEAESRGLMFEYLIRDGFIK